MNMKKLFIPEYEIDYIWSKPKAFAAAYSDPKYDPDYSEDVSYHEFIDINRIWHDVSEQPKFNKWVVGHLDQDCFDTSYIESYARWRKWCHFFKVKRWAYIEELFPKQQKEYKE